MPDQDMMLPPGETCSDCIRFQHCRGFLGKSFHPGATNCDWAPSIFQKNWEHALTCRVKWLEEAVEVFREVVQFSRAHEIISPEPLAVAHGALLHRAEIALNNCTAKPFEGIQCKNEAKWIAAPDIRTTPILRVAVWCDEHRHDTDVRIEEISGS